MKSKWFIVVIIVLVVLLALGFMYSKGLIHVKWQWLAVILAGLAGPFKFLSSLFSKQNNRITQIQQQQAQRIQNEQLHRQQYDQQIHDKDERIKNLESQVLKMQDQMQQLETQKQQTEVKINNMNDANKLQDAFGQAYDDES